MAKVLTHRGIEVHQMYPGNEFYWRPKTGPARKAVNKVDAIAQINRYLGADVMPRIEAERMSLNVSQRIIDDQMINLWATVERLIKWVKDTGGWFTVEWTEHDGRHVIAVKLTRDGQGWIGYHREDVAAAALAALEAYRTNTQKGKA